MTSVFASACLRSRPVLVGLAVAAGLLLGGCATVAHPNAADPWEPFNRSVYQFNEGLDQAVVKPVATAYRQALPRVVRTGVSNFFGNLGDLWSAVNSLLQLKVGQAAENFMRVNVNTFFGLGGLLDIASDLHIERHREDFGQTLGHWGVPSGPYLVLPVLGPSTVRDAAAMPVDRRLDPVHYINPEGTRDGLYVLRVVNTRANLLGVGEVLEGAALDKYSFTRDAYLQRRQAEVFEDGDGWARDDADAPAETPAEAPAQAATQPTAAPAAAEPPPTAPAH